MTDYTFIQTFERADGKEKQVYWTTRTREHKHETTLAICQWLSTKYPARGGLPSTWVAKGKASALNKTPPDDADEFTGT
jgi:hypothetical protein